jgi:hypothetical protein
LSGTVWQGQTRPFLHDPDFVQFTAPLYGLRALMKTLLTYYQRYTLDTVQSLINRYAPPHENATDNYIEEVAKALNAGRFDKIDVTAKQTLIALAQAIVLYENGRPPPDRPSAWYDPALYDQAAALAGVT